MFSYLKSEFARWSKYEGLYLTARVGIAIGWTVLKDPLDDGESVREGFSRSLSRVSAKIASAGKV